MGDKMAYKKLVDYTKMAADTTRKSVKKTGANLEHLSRSKIDYAKSKEYNGPQMFPIQREIPPADLYKDDPEFPINSVKFSKGMKLGVSCILATLGIAATIAGAVAVGKFVEFISQHDRSFIDRIHDPISTVDPSPSPSTDATDIIDIVRKIR